MVEKEKVQNMTKLAIFEKKYKKQLDIIKTTYRSDYISAKLMKNWFRITLSFCAGFVLWALYRLDEIAASLNELEPVQFGFQILTVYLITMGSYLIFTWVIYTIRYRKMEKIREEYQKLLSPLLKEYQKTEKRRTRE